MARRAITYELTPAEVLLAEIMRYCVETRMGEKLVGQLALDHPGFVGLLRKRGTLRDKTAERVRAFMRRWPHGTTPQQVQEAAQADARAEAERVRAASIAAAPGLAETVRAEAEEAVARRANARVLGGMPTISARRRVDDLVGAMIDDPSDIVAIVRRRWPAMWAELREQAAAAQISPAERLFDVIRAGMAG